MKRPSAGTAPLRDVYGVTDMRAAHTGLHPEDAALLSMLRQDAPPAVETLFDWYHDDVHGLAMAILMDKGDAEEATRDVLLTVVEKADRFHGAAPLRPWVYRVCVNACLSRLHDGRRTETVPIEEFLPVFTGEGSHARPVEDWTREVERRIPEKELGQVIGGFSRELPEKYRVVFALCDVRGFSCEETAQVLDLTGATVKSRLHRARLCLRERLGRYLRDGRGT